MLESRCQTVCGTGRGSQGLEPGDISAEVPGRGGGEGLERASTETPLGVYFRWAWSCRCERAWVVSDVVEYDAQALDGVKSAAPKRVE